MKLRNQSHICRTNPASEREKKANEIEAPRGVLVDRQYPLGVSYGAWIKSLDELRHESFSSFVIALLPIVDGIPLHLFLLYSVKVCMLIIHHKGSLNASRDLLFI